MEELAMNMCGCGHVGFECSCNPNRLFYSGSTAVVVVLTDEYIVVANCGDSRAILCSSGTVIPLSIDHKPDRPDELARIEASGGCVLVLDDGPRVGGILSMSRAIGDGYLKPFVISVPEINFIRRTDEQEFLTLASDGLWDVMSNEMTCHVVRECLREERFGQNEGPGLFPSRCASAAGLLTNLALARRSADNITVVVVDLKRTIRA
ncbi:putative protein phosphatase 2C 75 [Abeliophyllum distichum]|uniref:PPM-type phosphatase domain-containing protein n=1 Tax=Abeliophyllum distichum TaxID=126358 RepID=A0ABD1URV1_9LAMI